MLNLDLEKLIHSLSSAEKKQFLFYSNRLKNEKYYFKMYELILSNKEAPTSNWQACFKEQFPKVPLESTANYLYKVLTDVLVQIRIEQNSWFQQMHGLMKAELCFERSIHDRGLKEIKSVYKKAMHSENLSNLYLALRMELDALSSFHFSKIDEQQLIDKQMEAKMLLRSIHEIQEHHSLYELLSIRLENNPNLGHHSNDLILGELNLSFKKSKNLFKVKKVHLLFQSFYFIHKNDYYSALKIFKELVQLFESNSSLWNYPPYGYLSTLDGILNSLRSMLQYHEMQAFIDKITNFKQGQYSEHFNTLAVVTANVYQLNCCIGLGNIEQAKRFIKDKTKLRLLNFGDKEKKMEWFYFHALTLFLSKEYPLAKKVLNELFNDAIAGVNFPIFRAARILYILTIHEIHSCEYIDSEVRAYKRIFQKQESRYKIEKLVFKVINTDPKRKGKEWKKKLFSTLKPQMDGILSSKSEVPLTKYFDYKAWLQEQLIA